MAKCIVLQYWQNRKDHFQKILISFVHLLHILELRSKVYTVHGIYELCDELSNVWQWDLADESRALSKVSQNWNEYDQIDVWVYTERKEENAEFRQLFG